MQDPLLVTIFRHMQIIQAKRSDWGAVNLFDSLIEFLKVTLFRTN